MIVALTAAALTWAPSQTPTQQEDIVVTARRLKDWRGKASGNARASQCRTTRSTGDAALDQIACDTLAFCVGRVAPDLAALNDRKIKRAVREQMAAALNRRMADCGNEQHRLRVADMLDRRHTAGSHE